jgi:hypothetical protein
MAYSLPGRVRHCVASFVALLSACLLLCLGIADRPPRHVQPRSFDARAYQELADADSSQSIPPGTRIGTRNWQHKKLLFQTHLDLSRALDERSYDLHDVPRWPKRISGPWQLRQVSVVEKRTLASNTAYCCGGRVSYLDQDRFVSRHQDICERQMRLWKVFNTGSAPGPINGGHGSTYFQGTARSMTLDVINSHATVSIQSAPGLANSEMPEKYRDVQVWALPAGLPQMNP